MSYVSHDGLAYFKHKLDQKFISNITSEDGALKIVLGDGTVLKNIQDTTVTQKKSTANELYPLLLCYDAMADQDQLSKETWFGQHILANPYYGYIASRGMYVKHPTFNRRNGVSQKVEWAYDFTDAVSGLGNPMSQVYAYVDPATQGGEHCIELRLYGNPNVSPVVPSVNDSTNTFSIGVGVTGGNVQFGYCPSTPLYLDDGSTLRTEATGHGNDIITRDWLNLNGSFTGLVHTTMNETIDGAKTFKKTVTINSGDNSNKAGLYVQGNSDVHGNEHVYGTDTVDGKLTANGTAEIKGGSGNTPSLTVTGSEYVSGNSNIHGNMDVDGNSNTDGNQTVGGTSTIIGKLTANGTAEIKGGSGNTPSLTVTGDEKVTGNSTVNGNETVTGKITGNNGAEINGGNGLVVNGNETVNGEIYKLINNTPQEYVSYVTNKQETKTTIVNNLIKDKGGLAVDSNKNIYVNTGKGLNLDNTGKINVDFSQLPAQDVTNIITGMVAPGSGLVADSNTGKLAVDFNQMPTDKFEALLSSLKMLVPISSNLTFNVNNQHPNKGDTLIDNRGTANYPFETIQACVNYVTGKYSVGNQYITIYIHPGTYDESVRLPDYARGGGAIRLFAADNENPPVIRRTGTVGTNNISVTGSVWFLRRLKFVLQAEAGEVGTYNANYVIAANNNSTTYIDGCEFDFSYFGEKQDLVVMYGLGASNADIRIRPMFGYKTKFKYNKGLAKTCIALLGEVGGKIYFERTYASDQETDIECEGDATTFLYLSTNSLCMVTGPGTHSPHFTIASGKTCTGIKYVIGTNSGTIAPYGGYPGTADTGTVDSNTYCWYQQLPS